MPKLRSIFDLDAKRQSLNTLEKKAVDPKFWEDSEKATQISTQIKEIKEEIGILQETEQTLQDLKELNGLALSEKDEALSKEVGASMQKVKGTLEKLQLESWFSEKMDNHDAIIDIHPGAGGTESQDWAEMLLRMYLRWSQDKGFKTTLNEVTPGDGAGIKSATVTIGGKNVFGLLKAEKGVHRLVRISPFDSSKRRHTSFASVDTTPVLDDEEEIVVDQKDLRIETYRASGAGGQHVNVTDSAVRITHIPTKIVVQCQNERSQNMNKQTCLKILKAKIYEREQEIKKQEMAQIKGEKKEIAWGSQIRSYVLHPYRMVKDHRTNLESGKVDAVLDGALDDFIKAYLFRRKNK